MLHKYHRHAASGQSATARKRKFRKQQRIYKELLNHTCRTAGVTASSTSNIASDQF